MNETQREATIRNQIEILSVAEGFLETSVLLALLRLNVFDAIGDGEKTLAELADGIGARPDTLARLLNAGVVLKILDASGEARYRLSPASCAVLLPSAGEDYLGDWIRNMDYFRLAVSRLDEAVRASGPTVDPSAHIGNSAQETYDFTMAMHNYASLRGKELAEFLDTSSARSLLDLGCGPGTYGFNLAERNPELDIYLLDLEGVLKVARQVAGRYAIRNKVTYLPRDVTQEEIPGTYDIVLVSNTLHMLGEKESRALLRRLYATVNRGGSLVIQAQYLKNNRQGGRWPIFLDLIQLCITREGRNHTEAETRAWMEEAGFADIEFCPMTLLNTNSYLRGYKR